MRQEDGKEFLQKMLKFMFQLNLLLLGFKHVVSFRLENNKNHQVVKITPVQARWVKFVITSNYGYEGQTELGQLGAYDDGIRVKSIKDEMSKK